jgi:peroxiredoxin
MRKLTGFGTYGNEERMAPLFTLSCANGTQIKSWSYKQRQALVIYFISGNEFSFLETLEQAYPQYKKENIELLVITALNQNDTATIAAEYKLSYPVLADPDYQVYSRYVKLIQAEYSLNQNLEKPVAVFVVDRYGSIFSYATAPTAASLPKHTEILGAHEFISCLCNP